MSLRERYCDHYVPAVGEFIRAVGDVNVAGFPEVHLPLWGAAYEDETTNPRIVFIGRDTWCWGNMVDFVEKCAGAESNPIPAIHRMEEREKEFREYPFRKKGAWRKNKNSVFWDTVMRFLAAFHDISDWKQLKTNKPAHEILKTFAWANVNAVEVWDKKKLPEWEKHASGKKADPDSWRLLDAAANQHLDSFSVIQEVFQPHIAIVMSRQTPPNYWGVVPQWETIDPWVEYAFVVHKGCGTHIFHTDHPNHLRFCEGGSGKVINAILSKWRIGGR